MKVNNLLKRIGSVVTTAAMLATLGTTGFAADPVDVTGTKNDGSNIKITSVKRTDMGSGVYKFTIGYDSEDASKQNSIGVTMLTYVMSDRSGISAGTAYNDSTMQIVGVNQETQTNTTGNIEFSVATSEDSSALSPNALLMTSGQKGLVMIGGDNTTPAVAEFSIPAAAKPIVAVTVSKVEGKLDGVNVTGSGSEYTIATVPCNTSFSKVKEAINFVIKNGDTPLTKDTDYTVAWDKKDSDMLISNITATATVKLNSTADYDFGSGANTKTYTFNITVGEKPAEAFTAKSFGAVDKEVSVGTAKADVISSLPITATAYENADKTGTSATVNVENWTSSDYDASKIGEYTFTATVPVQTQEGVVKVTEAGTVSVKVTTKAITVDATKTVAVNVPVGYTAETVANALPAKLTYTNDTLTDTVDVTWTAIGAADLGKADGATFTVNGTVAEASDNRLFNFDPKVVTATVTVRNSVESNKAWELGNTGEYNAGTVKVYLPTTAKKDDVVIATLYKADGTTLAGATATVTLTSDYNADTYNSVDLTFDKSFNAAGINANDKYTVKVTVAGTPLVYKDAENNDADSVQGTVYPTTSRRPSTGGGSTTPEVKSYNVSVKADNNGKATVNKSKATAGETVAVNVEPNEGYKVKEITVKDVNGKSIDVDQKTRTFEMPEGAVTVTVTFEEGTEEPTPDDKGKFKDVPDSFWAAADIYTLREAGIIDGKTADEFDPEGQVTRAEFTKMIVKMFGVEAKDTKVEFADCGEDDWFTPFVAAAVEAGYVKGYSDTEFAPDKVISREEACAILGRAYAKAANSELSFTDKDSIDEYAQPYVALLVEMGFINGYEDGTFRAQNQITRAEAAKIIGCAYRLATASK